jgi:hypothetical protein
MVARFMWALASAASLLPTAVEPVNEVFLIVAWGSKRRKSQRLDRLQASPGNAKWRLCPSVPAPAIDPDARNCALK